MSSPFGFTQGVIYAAPYAAARRWLIEAGLHEARVLSSRGRSLFYLLGRYRVRVASSGARVGGAHDEKHGASAIVDRGRPNARSEECEEDKRFCSQ